VVYDFWPRRIDEPQKNFSSPYDVPFMARAAASTRNLMAVRLPRSRLGEGGQPNTKHHIALTADCTGAHGLTDQPLLTDDAERPCNRLCLETLSTSIPTEPRARGA
jgi:hypothetical protein